MIEIDIKDLTKKYKDVVAVDNLNIQIKTIVFYYYNKIYIYTTM